MSFRLMCYCCTIRASQFAPYGTSLISRQSDLTYSHNSQASMDQNPPGLYVSVILYTKYFAKDAIKIFMFARFEVSLNIKRQRITVSLGVVSCSSTMRLIPATQSWEYHDKLRSLVILAGMGVGVRQQQLVAQLGLWPLCTVAGGMGWRDEGRAKER